MTLATMGGAGMGLVWGWLLTLFGGRTRPQRRQWPNRFLLFFSTCLVSLLAYVYAGWRGLVAFLVSTAVAAFVSLVWYRSLRTRSAPS
jgi:hypothetical protein